MNFTFPKVKHKYPLSRHEIDSFRVKPRPAPADWADENLTLCTGGYDIPGKLYLKPYQTEPINSIVKWHRVIFKGATRTFKSGMADIMMFYGMTILGVNGIVAYSEENTVSLIFRTRTKPMILQNLCLRELWDGNQDNITQEKILLRTCFWRIASAQNRNTLSSTGAGFVIGSEVGKWEEMDYDPVEMLYGRQDAYPRELRRSILESSPYDIGTYFYREIYRKGTLILQPHYPCPICGDYQVLTDSQIKLRKANEDTPNHEPARIRMEKEAAVYYECLHCKQEILERDRAEMDTKVIWAAPEIVEVDADQKPIFKQEPEKILKTGEIAGMNRERYDTVCYDWNRLVDLNFPFWECLARFFDSVHNPEKKKVYETETMARFWRTKHTRINISRFEAAKDDYNMTGPDTAIPNDILVITCGIDSQDKDFYYILQGWGMGMLSRILRYGTIYWPINDPAYADREKMLAAVLKGLIGGEELKRRDGVKLGIRMGFIDRGGHRPDDVDFLVSRISFLQAYIGFPRTDPKRDLIFKSDTGNWFMGQSEQISEFVGMLVESDQFRLPKDADWNFLNAITRHYHIMRKDPYGNEKKVWVKLPDDHYRSCLEYSYAAAKLLRLDTMLVDDNVLKRVREALEKTKTPQETKPPAHHEPRQPDYFSRALR